MRYCCVRGCENNSKKNVSPLIAFHAFPSNPELKSKWLKAIGRPDWKPPKSMRLCSAHFSENDTQYYENRIRLKEDAYPVCLLPWNTNFDASHVKACRVCLATDFKMCSIQDKAIARCMDSIMQLNENQRTEGLPPYVCYICAAHLRNSYNFIERCRSAQTILRDIFNQHGQITKQLVEQRNRHEPNLLTTLTYYHTPLTEVKCVPFDDDIIIEDVLEKYASENCYNEQIEYEDEGDVEDVESSEEKVDIIVLREHDYAGDVGQSSPRSESQEYVESPDVDGEMKKQTVVSKPKKKDNLSPPKTKKIILREALLSEIQNLEKLEEYFNIEELSEKEQLSEWLNNRCHSTSLPTIAKCYVCFKQFAHEDCYKTHLPKHDPSRGKAVCPICKERFRNDILVRTHVKSVHLKKYTCNICSIIRYNRRTAKTHFLRHTGAKFRCKREGCGFEAGTAAAVYTHARTAHARGTHACTACGRSCLTPQALGLHVHAAHPDLKDAEGSPDFRCNDCDLNFLSEAARRVHLLSFCPHTNKSDPSDTAKEDQFENTCSQCGETCASAAELTSHVRTTHRYVSPSYKNWPTSAYPTMCEYCGMSVGSRREHFMHVNRTHPSKRHTYRAVVNAVCHLCGKGYQNKAMLKLHVLRHAAPAVRCERCGRMFHDKWQLARHARARHAGPAGPPRHACAQCGLTFAYRSNFLRHFKVHSDDTPYDCPMCDKKFKHSTSRNVHIRTVHLKEPHPSRKKRTKGTSSRQRD